ncbi:MAG: PIN domain-containing protein [Thermoplasmata archaeon]
MRCFDATFLIDYVRGGASAVEKVRELLEASERMTTPAIAAAEVLVGAHYRGGRELSQTLELLELLDVVPFGIGEATEAGRLGAESMRRGAPLVGNDLLVAATARHHRGILVSRDAVFSGVPGLAVEVY